MAQSKTQKEKIVAVQVQIPLNNLSFLNAYEMENYINATFNDIKFILIKDLLKRGYGRIPKFN